MKKSEDEENRKSIAYALPCLEYEKLVAIMKATECTEFLVEITNVKKEDTDEYVDRVFILSVDNEFQAKVRDIINSNPEIISVYCNCHSKVNKDIILEFMLDENVFILTCNCELYENLQLRISELL